MAVRSGSDGENRKRHFEVSEESVMGKVLLAVPFHDASCCYNSSGRTGRGLSECCCLDIYGSKS